jgi:hypothetical protein
MKNTFLNRANLRKIVGVLGVALVFTQIFSVDGLAQNGSLKFRQNLP